MNLKRYLPVVALALIMVLVISACAAPAAAPATTDAPAAAPTTEAAAPAEAPAASDKPVIAGVVFQSDTFMQTVQNGLQAAADEAGVDLILGNTENDLAKESSMIDDYITRGVDAIVITPISADGSLAALKKAKEAGITIICFNTCVSEDGIASAFLVTKNEDLGST
ncbi:MAG: substrate-binding domain-containing protein, partial [Anaerolineae bacterium]|nr:substrate-binding domain-containing protein [Anaerolineae bacterium]